MLHSENRAVIDIIQSVKVYTSIVPDLLAFHALQGQTYQQLLLALKGSKHSRWPELLGSRYMLLEIHKQMKLLYSRKLRHSYLLAMAKVSADLLA